ncbi:MAG: flagellar hook protein FlgE [Lachnospiraceae bacterium]|nr:flagellar hook protein FlgE [Lachnospiraceae bacterium]
MMRSLYSGVTGLKTHQIKMDVIGNNIANVNTTSYKSQSVTFSELMYQTTQNASGPSEGGKAGVNARQVGLGVKSGATKVNIETAGSSQSTGNPFDVRITGDSFFIVNDGATNFFTRDGSFYVDAAGNLAMSSNGYNVMGWGVDSTSGKIKPDLVQPLKVMDADNLTYPPEATTAAYVSGIIDKNDASVNTEAGRIISLSLYDNKGYTYTAKLSMKATADEGKYTVELKDLYDTAGNSVKTDDMVLGSGVNTLQYDTATGVLKSVNGVEAGTGVPPTPIPSLTLKLKADGDTTSAFENIDIDFSPSTNYNNNKVSTIGTVTGDREGKNTGRRLGQMSGISVQTDGKIYASYDNGQTKLLGQIAVAKFSNASGLEKEGDNLYTSTLNSGEFDGIGLDITSDGGYMNTGVLEMSNVDLSAEFTEMITTQRGFQANSRIITVSDTLLEELVNLKR